MATPVSQGRACEVGGQAAPVLESWLRQEKALQAWPAQTSVSFLVISCPSFFPWSLAALQHLCP